jgi:histidinol dehydrogenase
MRILRYNQPDFAEALAGALAASSLFDPTIEERVRDIIAAVQQRGDAALLEFSERFDGVKLTAAQVAVTEPTPAVDAALRKAVATAQTNVAAFAKRALPKNWQMRNAQGGRVGEKFDPLQRVGVYIPGGTAPLVSTAIMTIAIAKVAGCKEIVACTPPNKGAKNLINPNLLYALRKAGATEIYRVGGAQAIAAMAVGTQTIKRVQKIFGPGNAYVTAAKRLVFGRVGVDLLAGPSELLVIADDSADARFIAADMLAQAEHGSGRERVWLVTTSERILDAAQREIQRQQQTLGRGGFIGRALDANGVCILVRDVKQAVEVANRFAPEHCEIMTKSAAKVANAVKTAGAIFVGAWSPTVVGDYMAGPSHELPTGGAGAAFAGLTVDQFQRRTSIVEFSESALRKSMPALETIGAVEGLDAHVKSARIRFTGT